MTNQSPERTAVEARESWRQFGQAHEAMAAHFLPDMSGLAGVGTTIAAIVEVAEGDYKTAAYLGAASILLAVGGFFGGHKVADKVAGPFGPAQMKLLESGPLGQQ